MTTTAPVSVLNPRRERARTERAVLPSAHRFRAGFAIAAIGYLVLTATLLFVGWLLTHPLNGSVGHWDEQVNEYLARRRTSGLNGVTGVATALFNTLPVVLAAGALAGFLAWRRCWREVVFLTAALLLEISVFLSVTFVVARPRPDVVRLNSTPATSSFPSGHTAAATVLLVAFAIIVMCSTHNFWARAGSWLLAGLTIASVGFGRVYRGLHHPTDVVIGLLFGLACLVVSALAVRAVSLRAERNENRPDHTGDGGDLRMSA